MLHLCMTAGGVMNVEPRSLKGTHDFSRLKDWKCGTHRLKRHYQFLLAKLSAGRPFFR